MEQTKVEVSKPILSPTRSLDEGFESDPDRISTDSEHTAQTPTFDLLHRTDRDGVQHTTISRRTVESSPISSIICLDGESESDNNAGEETKPVTKSDQQTQTKADQQPKQVYRRVKNKAPLPPNSNKSNSTSSTYQTIQPRSQSVDRIRSSLNDFHKSSTPNANNQNILAGRFVRVTVDPQQQYMSYFKSYKSYQNQQNYQTSRLLPTGSTSNLYKSYHLATSSSNKSSLSQPNSHEPSGLLSLSNLSNMMPIQYGGGFATVKAPKSYHHQQFSSQQSQPQSHLVCWTQSMDPRRARK
jgi:hypothetical protein